MREKELVFTREIDIENTKKKLIENGYACVVGSNNYTIVDKAKNWKEVKRELRTKLGKEIKFIRLSHLWVFFGGITIGLFLSTLIYLPRGLALRNILIVFFFFSIISFILLGIASTMRKHLVKIISLNSNSIYLVGEFDEQDIKRIKDSIIFAKSREDNQR